MTNKFLPIIDLFTSIQGEGKYAGTPSIFIRTSGCNLKCVFGNSICDTPYSSFNPEQSKYTVESVKNEILNHPNVKHLVITGGEPMLYQEAIVDMFEYLSKEIEDFWGYFITIETNGSVNANDELNDYVDLWSISPKLSTAVAKIGQEVNTPAGVKVFTEDEVNRFHSIRINMSNIANLILSESDTQLKFVYSGEESLAEIKTIICDLQSLVYKYLKDSGENIFMVDVNQYVMLMPEGMTEEVLSKHRCEAAELCVQNGWQYTDRLHITIWGDKRGY